MQERDLPGSDHCVPRRRPVPKQDLLATVVEGKRQRRFQCEARPRLVDAVWAGDHSWSSPLAWLENPQPTTVATRSRVGQQDKNVDLGARSLDYLGAARASFSPICAEGEAQKQASCA